MSAVAEQTHTSDLQPRPNGLTREEWLHGVLYSGEVTRISQHLALVIYHLADTTTNIAKLSARDLERITGWSKSAIADHMSELEVFVRVKWGAGRAKSIFELQGIITQVLEHQKTASQPDTTIAATAAEASATNPSVRPTTANADATDATNLCGSEAAATVATTADTTPCVHDSVRQDATNDVQKPLGGTIGGEINNYPSKYNTHSPERGSWNISEDGGFEGRVFELSGADVEGLKKVYLHLEWPAELVAADQFFAREFDRVNFWPAMDSRLAGLHMYLAKQNRKVVELRRSYEALATSKGHRKPAEPIAPTEPPSCWFDPADARLHVANGFKTELLDAVGGDEIRLRLELDKAAGWIGVNVRGPQLLAKVRSRVVEQVKGGRFAAADDPQAKRARREKALDEAAAKIDAENARRRWS